MTAKRIKKVALHHFAKYGYEGASLANIADEVGIKKPSIYTHFKGKDDLFLHVFQDVFDHELEFIDSHLKNSEELPLKDRLYRLILQYKDRNDQDEREKFWMRSMFFPPEHLHDHVTNYLLHYSDKMKDLLIPIFDKAMDEGEISPIEAEQASIAFMCLLDGILLEMLSSVPERFEKRLNASWDLYWLGLQKSKNSNT